MCEEKINSSGEMRSWSVNFSTYFEKEIKSQRNKDGLKILVLKRDNGKVDQSIFIVVVCINAKFVGSFTVPF